MRAMFAGAALAAAMTFQCAEVRADFISVVGDDAKYGRVTLKFYYTNFGSGVVVPSGASDGIQFGDNLGFQGVFTPNNISLNPSYTQPGIPGDPPLPSIIDNGNVNISLPSGKSFVDGQVYGIGSGLSGTAYISSVVGGATAYSVSINVLAAGINTVASVPLPASAPLFGAALLAIAMAGYGAKRKGAATA